MAKVNRDFIAGLSMLLFSILLYLVIIPAQVDPSEGGPIALSPRLFCQITAALLFVLSLNLTVSGFKKGTSESGSETAEGSLTERLTRGSIAVAASALYIVAISYIGYFVSTALAVVFFLVFFGTRSLKGIISFLVIILPFIYLLFVKALKVVLPDGVAF